MRAPVAIHTWPEETEEEREFFRAGGTVSVPIPVRPELHRQCERVAEKIARRIDTLILRSTQMERPR